MLLRRRRTAFALYTVLLVLPTVVLGVLQWRQLSVDRAREVRAVPAEAEAAAARLRDAIEERVGALLEAEERRPFSHYAQYYATPDQVGDDLAVQVSPLRRALAPEGLLGWFSYDRGGLTEAPVELFLELPDDSPLTAAVPLEFAHGMGQEPWVRWWGRAREPETVPIDVAVAAVHRGYEQYRQCLEDCYVYFREESLPILLSRFHVIMYRDASGAPRVVATRRAMLLERIDYPSHMHCLDPLRSGFGLVQGFFLDPDWLFDELPRSLSASVLSSTERLQLGDEAPPSEPGGVTETFSLVDTLDLEVAADDAATFARMGDVHVSRSTRAIEERFARQRSSFLVLAAMLLVSLVIGMGLLLRSVSREVAQVREREDFIAAVTHELRTPLAAIRLLGEMLLEGWITDPKSQREYHERIVGETNRLSTLVERVLAKARLTRSGADAARPGDLNEAVRATLPELDAAAGGASDDLVLDLAEDLPPVLLEPEAMSHVLTNLVENARKYAGAAEEPIRVETALRDGRVVLEVLDRGPGVPAEEKERIFDAFYRAGREATRTAPGTGLGLHLVQQYATAIGARVSVRDRAGGGAVFRVRFKRARTE